MNFYFWEFFLYEVVLAILFKEIVGFFQCVVTSENSSVVGNQAGDYKLKTLQKFRGT